MASIVVAGVLTFFWQTYSQKNTSLSVLQDGMNTCFGRVNQSFTAYMIGDLKSYYLQSGFLKLSQECFKDVQGELKHHFSKKNPHLVTAFQTMQGELDSFHLLLEKSGAEQFDNSIPQAFEKLEERKNFISDEWSTFANRTQRQMVFLGTVLFGLMALLTVFLTLDLLQGHRKEEQNNQLEAQALYHLESDLPMDKKVEELLLRSLEQNKLLFCSKLFRQYKKNLIERPMRWISREALPNNNSFALNSPSQQKIEEKSIPFLTDASHLEKVYLIPIFSQIAERFSHKFMTHGILLDFQIPEDLYVFGQKDLLQQTFFGLMAHALKQCVEKNAWMKEIEGNVSAKKITVRTLVQGQIVLLEIGHAGEGFSQEGISSLTEMEARFKGHSAFHYESSYLRVAHELVKEMCGYMSLQNHHSAEGKVWGASIQLLLQKAEISSIERIHLGQEEDGWVSSSSPKRVQQVVKGKKKDILRHLNAEA